MIKRIIGSDHKTESEDNEHWLTLDTIAQVEVTSEEMAHPIESGLLPNSESGWEAAQPGPQTVVFSLNGHKESSVCIWSFTNISRLALRNLFYAGRQTAGGPTAKSSASNIILVLPTPRLSARTTLWISTA